MTGFFDMHVHSTFSIDGVSTMEDYCLIAEKSGIRAICFTEHVDYNSEEKNLSIIKDNRKYNFVVEDYFCELNRLREKYSSIILLSGIEFSEPNMFPDEFAAMEDGMGTVEVILIIVEIYTVNMLSLVSFV